MKLFEDVAKSGHKNYYPELTGLRGLAALWVCSFHVRQMTQGASNDFNMLGLHLDFSSLFSMGAMYGVQIFFVLSGFLLSIPFIRYLEGDSDYPQLKNYYTRRIMRVFPAYYFQLFFLLLVAYLAGDGFILSIKSFILHLFMMFRVEPWWVDPLEGVWWTLPTEFAFYLTLPLIAIGFKKIGIVKGVILGVALTIGFRYLLYQSVATSSVGMVIAKVERFPGHLSLFLIGMTTSYLFYRLKKVNFSVKPWMLWGILIAGILGIFWTGTLLRSWVIRGEYFSGHYGYFVWNSLNAVFLACVIFAAAYRLCLCRWLLGNPVCLFLGTISYSVYLWHFPIMKFAKSHLFVPDYTENMQHLLISFPLVIIVSALSYQFIEAPAIRWGSRLTR